MEYVKDIKPREIPLFPQGIKKDKKDVAYVKFLSNGMKIIVLVAILN
jgi:hypothetical protein